MYYDTLAAEFQGSIDHASFASFLYDVLPDRWCDAYQHMANDDAAIVQVSDEGYDFLFDLVAERVVVAFGLSRTNPASRDRSRMQGFLGRGSLSSQNRAAMRKAGALRPDLSGLSWRERFLVTHGADYDRGHFISHLQGGGLDINLFPQLSHVNQGRSPEGREYRNMERWCAAHPGTFCFSRPIYCDTTWVPHRLEYGMQTGPRELVVRVFPNKPEP